MQAQSQGPSSPPHGQAGGPAANPSLFGGYRPGAGRHDECCGSPAGSSTADGWRRFAQQLDRLGPDGLASAWRRGEDMLRESGIAHSLLAGSPDSSRRWDLDPIPMILGQEDWEVLAAGARQRARLWNRILHDCYGDRQLLASGLLPPSLLFSHPGYNRSLRHLTDPTRPLLSLYAVDVARGPDGRWTVVADRTEAPNGTGFALENRVVLSNVFPGISNDLHLVRVASFFQDYLASLQALAPAGVDSPSIVLLSPGPDDKTYFEDAYLTRYLGITLAVGSELTVREDRLFLKTVRGLQRVHVLIRRVNESDTDPLEIPNDSHLGVPGLMQAMRSGTVAVVNPPGTGIAESPAFLPFLPAIARQLLGEDLLLPSIETHWNPTGFPESPLLGTEPAVIKGAFTRHAFPPRLTRGLDANALAKLRNDLAGSPGSHVVQREMPFSTAPAWTGSTLEARPVAIRLFLYADADAADYRILPGGLVRCAARPDALPGLSLHEDTSSKDLWILSPPDQLRPHTSNLPVRVPIRRSSGTLSSHSADNMLWIGRYSERAECATRLLLEIVLNTTAEQETDELPSVPPLLRTLAKLDYLDPSAPMPAEIDRRRLLASLVEIFCRQDSPRPSPLDSIPSNLERLRALSAFSRERLSNETWRIVQQLEGISRTPPPLSLSGFRAPLQQAILLHSAFNGTCRENLSRNQSWRFLNIGRRLERCLWLLTLVEEALAPYPELPSQTLDAILSITDCTLTYRFRYQGAPQPVPALDLLLFDPVNPRGLAYQLTDLDQAFRELPPTDDPAILRPAHRSILRALHFCQTELPTVVDDASEAAAVADTFEFVSQLRAEIPHVAEQLGWEFFTHASFTAS